MKRLIPTLFISLILIASCNSRNQVKLEVAEIFGDNMVLQQEQKLPVWGTAETGKKVIVRFRDQLVETKVDEEGKWQVSLSPMIVDEPDSLIIESGKQKIIFENVLVGEVWLCSGQSNMEMNVACSWATVDNSAEEVANANYPEIRLFIVNRNTSVTLLNTLNTSGWKVCSPETVGDFSAVGYFFGREIYQTQNIPVGLIQSAWGGTVAEAWTSGESLKLMEAFAGSVEKLERSPQNSDTLKLKYEADYRAWLLETTVADAGIRGTDTIFSSFELDDSEWMTMEVPGMWEANEIGALDGVVWFRKIVNVPANQQGKNLMLTIAPPDDADETWFNGVKVGESAAWDVVREYAIPANIVKEGENLIAVRLSDFQGDGGFMGEDEDFSLSSNDGWKITFVGEWLCQIGFDNKVITVEPMKPDDPNRPTVLYNAMINPVIPYGIRGAIWYQGESNTGMAYQYRELFPTMINDWRKHWGIGDFPFLFVQLAGFMPRNKQPVEDPWAELREAQLMTLSLPNTAMAVTIDIGDAKDVHPANKQDVGKRLAFAARNTVYSEDIPFSGPVYSKMKKEGNKIKLEFDFVYDGLSTKDGGKLTGFAIAGTDKVFHWAIAKVVGNKVVVYSKKVKMPIVVRYGWSSNPDCNLINSAGLPASPFRTDDWPGQTAPDEMRE